MEKKRSLLFLLLLTLYPAWSWAQTGGSADTAQTVSSWTLGMELSNNATFYGRISDSKFPYVAPSVTYVHPTGLFGSVMAYQLFNTDDYIDETDVSLGYSFQIRQRIESSISYSHFFFAKNSPLVKSAVSNALNAYAGLDWNILYTGLTTSYFFGGSDDLFLVLENSRYFPLNQIWQGKRTVGVDPKISLTAGTQEFSEEYTTTSTYLITKGKGKGKGTGSGTGTTTTTSYTTKNAFNILNYDLKVPVVFNFGDLEVEPAWRLTVPVNLLDGEESKPLSFFSLNLNYSF